MHVTCVSLEIKYSVILESSCYLAWTLKNLYQS